MKDLKRDKKQKTGLKNQLKEYFQGDRGEVP